jgi:hypothetical protein
MSRLVCWWSAGVTSAVATALALRTVDADEKIVAYCASVERDEHPDNMRFLADCARWYGLPIQRLYADGYSGVEDVWEQRQYVAGIAGAPCTTFLKKKVRNKFQLRDDIQVFGFDAGEPHRADRFLANNNGIDARFPLIERGLSHADCLALLAEQKIELPAMYVLGYRNNNCIGCVKGGAGYWNKIRGDFPEVFARRAEQSRRLGAKLIRVNGVRAYLDELPLGAGRYEAEETIECGVGCDGAMKELCP